MKRTCIFAAVTAFIVLLLTAIPVNASSVISSFSAKATTESVDNSGKLLTSTTTESTVGYLLSFSLVGTDDFEAGDIQILIPAYLFESKDGSTEYLEFYTSLPEKDSYSSGNWYYEETDDGYVITNGTTIDSSSEIALTVYYTGTYDYQDIADGTASIEDTFVLTVEDNGTEYTSTIDRPTVYYYSSVSASSRIKYSETGLPSATKCQYYEEFPDLDWAEEPSDSDDYIWVLWVTVLKYDENTQDSTVETSGTVTDGLGEIYATYSEEITSTNLYGDVRYYLVRYSLDDLEDYSTFTFSFSDTSTVTGTDDGTVSTASGSYSLDWTNITTEESTGTYVIWAHYSSSEHMKNALEKGYDLTAYIGFSMEADTETLTLASGADEDDYDSYSSSGYTVNFIMDGAYINGESVLLDEDDYYLDKIQIVPAWGTFYNSDGSAYTENIPFTVYLKNGDGWYEYAYIDKDAGTITFSDGTVDDLSNYPTSTYEVTRDDSYGNEAEYEIDIPDDTLGVKIVYNTTAVVSNASVFADVVLYSSDYIVSVIENVDEAVVCFAGAFSITRDSGTIVTFSKGSDMSRYGEAEDIITDLFTEDFTYLSVVSIYSLVYLYELDATVSLTTEISNAENDTDNEVFDLDFTTTLSLIPNYTELGYWNDWLLLRDSGGFGMPTTSTFYLLLPAGVEYDGRKVYVTVSTIKLNDSARNYNRSSFKTYYTPAVTEDWRGSGRTMLEVTVTVPTGYSVLTAELTYGGTYTYEDAYDYGFDDIYTSAMYYYNSEPYFEDSKICSNDGDGLEDADMYAEILEDNSYAYLYAYDETAVALTYVAELSLIEYVKTENADDWGNGIDDEQITDAGETYTYRIRFGTQADTYSTNNVLYAVIEDYSGSEWHGYIEDIDLSQPKVKGSNPVVYYSTVSGLDLTNEDSRDLTNTEIWSTEIPEDSSTVTVIAFDLGSDFVLEETEVIRIDITMTAPENAGGYAKSNVYLSNTIYSMDTEQATNQNISYSYVQVLIEMNSLYADITAAKTVEDPAGTGIELSGGEYIFTLTAEDGTVYTATNDADGSIVFDNVEFESSGTYTFTLKETSGSDSHISYDDTEYTVVITVVNNNGVLQIESTKIN